MYCVPAEFLQGVRSLIKQGKIWRAEIYSCSDEHRSWEKRWVRETRNFFLCSYTEANNGYLKRDEVNPSNICSVEKAVIHREPRGINF